MNIQKIKAASGESLVEALVSVFLFLMMVAILQGAISFCTHAQHKSEQIRTRNAEICQKLPTASVVSNGSAEFSFRAVSADGASEGTETLFRIHAGLGKKEVVYEEEDGTSKSCTFYVFQPTGGGTP